jgi:AcrR family transcriptional regulator
LHNGVITGTAVPDIAELAGVGTGTIYRYFENKEDLVNAVLLHCGQTLKKVLLQDQGIFALNGTIRELFARFWGRLIEFAEQYPDEFQFLELQHHVPYRSEHSWRCQREQMLPLWFFAMLARQVGVIRDQPVELTVNLVWGMYVNLFKGSYAGYYPLTEQVFIQAEQNAWEAFSNGHDGNIGPEVFLQQA